MCDNGMFEYGCYSACDSREMLMIVANFGTRMSILAFMSEVGSGSSTLYLVGHFLTNEIIMFTVMMHEALTEQDCSQCI